MHQNLKLDGTIYSFSTGSLNSLTMSGEVKNHIFIKGLQPKYREYRKG